MSANPRTLQKLIEMLSQSMEQNEQKVIQQSEFASLSTSQIHYLDTISHLERPTISQLAKNLGVSKPSVTLTVDALQEMGYVRKVKSDQDLRVQHIHLTKKGKKIVTLHDAIHMGYAKYFEDALTKKELTMFVGMLNKVVDSMVET